MSDTVVVARAAEQHYLTEPILVVDPVHPNRLLGAAMLKATGAPGQETCAAFVSFDTGATWQRHDFPVTGCYDPWVAITPGGDGVLSILARDGGLIYHSADGGRTWDDAPLRLARGYDHPTLIVDGGSTERAASLHLVASWAHAQLDDGSRRHAIVVMSSRDRGKTFAESTQVVPNNLINLAEMPAVLSDGTVLISFVEAGGIGFQGRLNRFARWRAWVVRSTDGGRAFSAPLFVTDSCGQPPSFQLSAFAADTSDGPFHDRLYFVCGATSRGPIVLTSSADRGETWSDPIAVPPEVASADPENRRILGVAASRTGTLAVVHLERVAQAGDSCQNLYFAASLDGGRSFLPAQLIASAPCASFGDYFGIVATHDGRFRLLWPEVRDGVSRLLTVTVTVETAGTTRD